AGIDEDLRSGELPIADAHDARALEAGVTLDHGYIRSLAEPAFDALRRLGDDFVLARLHLRHLDANRAVDRHARGRGAACNPGRAGAGDKGLGRNAADVDASAAETIALDDRRLVTRAREADRQRGPGLAGADDDRVEAFGHGWPRVARWRRDRFVG